MFEVKNVNVEIKKRSILSDLSLKIPSGQIVGFLGPNGAGKTTTIYTCAGLYKKKSGSIMCNSTDQDLDYENYLRNISIIFDNTSFYPQLSGLENIKQFLRIYGKVDINKISEYVDLVGLSNRIHDNVSTYSLGMKQRLNLAISILRGTKMILMDEPLNGIDPEGIIDMRKIITDLRNDLEYSFLISSHMLKEIEQLADRILMIRDGSIVDDFMIKDRNLEYHYILINNPEDLNQGIDVLRSRGVEFIKDNDYTIKISGINNELSKCLRLLLDNGVSFSSVKTEKNIEKLYLEKMGGVDVE